MRSAITLLVCGAAALAATVPLEILPKRQADPSKVGYLAAYWKTSESGIFFALSDNANPLAFTEINGGSPIFVPTVGQKVARDISIISPEGDASKYYIVATDLNIDSYPSWEAASANGSKAIMIWDSTDLVTWSNERLITVEDETAGMAWAPDAIWDAAAGQYMVHWAAQLYAEDDTSHSNGAVTTALMRYAHTSDFQTFTAPTTYFEVPDDSGVIDLAFLKISDTSYARFYKTGVIVSEVGNDGLFGDFEPVGGTIPNFEGPYAFWDNTNDDQAFLIADRLGGAAGIGGYGPADPTTGMWVEDTSVDISFMRHGSVVAVTQEQYDALSAL
ncbi:hypothetical protein V5O48_011248 [Marasmius crinis-equi]|uniref:Uncharacterized protein n=1 Tax=Marasmius crinis-equi TaxID=585013 RepID=A0ABR3F6J5_9AGAR